VNKINQIFQLLSNMGMRYFSYRIFYELQRKTGLLQRKFPTKTKPVHCLSLAEWKSATQPFFFSIAGSDHVGEKAE